MTYESGQPTLFFGVMGDARLKLKGQSLIFLIRYVHNQDAKHVGSGPFLPSKTKKNAEVRSSNPDTTVFPP